MSEHTAILDTARDAGPFASSTFPAHRFGDPAAAARYDLTIVIIRRDAAEKAMLRDLANWQATHGAMRGRMRQHANAAVTHYRVTLGRCAVARSMWRSARLAPALMAAE